MARQATWMVWLRRLTGAASLLLLAACGGGGDGQKVPPAADCSVDAQKTWLRDYMNEWYFWYRLAPTPDPAPFSAMDSYFVALLYAGGTAPFPADRYSFTESTESFNRFYGEGRTLGYGIFVAGVEVTGRPDLPLMVRYIEPRSDAAARGVVRGEQVLALNGRSAADVIASNDFSALTPRNPGDTLQVQLRGAAGDRLVTLTASAYLLTPVSSTAVVTSAGGRRLGYVMVKDMIGQVSPALEAAFTQLRGAGVQDLVLDLRYNGGGLVSVATEVASHVAGAAASGRAFATLLYNDRRAATNNETFRFGNPAAALGVRRVFVLTGSRTCSASEQVVNGLRGVDVEVIAIGGATCGKPVGFLPASQCGTTFNAVNFESVNARNEGRYFDGFAPSCAVAEDFSRALGAADEPLLASAGHFADRGVCPAAPLARQATAARRAVRGAAQEPGERSGMIPRL